MFGILLFGFVLAVPPPEDLAPHFEVRYGRIIIEGNTDTPNREILQRVGLG